jgi:UDP-N-acetylmuramate dehydrogenase
MVAAPAGLDVDALPAGVVATRGARLARWTALRTGGPCPVLLHVHDPEALPATLAWIDAHDLRWRVVGAGTRTAWRDGGSDRAVIRLGVGFVGVEADGELLRVGAGTPGATVAWAAAVLGLAGLEGLARVPGSLGGAVRAEDPALDGRVVHIRAWRRGQVRDTPPERALKARLVAGAVLRGTPDAPDAIRARTREALAGARALPSRWAPLARGTPAEELSRVGAPGVRLRGWQIPVQSPETLVNLGGGTAADLELLHTSTRERVKKLRGVTLASTLSWAGRRGPAERTP